MINDEAKLVDGWVGYYRSLFHGADAWFSAEHRAWVPAAVSLYYSVFHLNIAALLITNPSVVTRSKEIKALTADPSHVGQPERHPTMTHQEVVNAEIAALRPTTARNLEELRNLREYASYRPASYLLSNTVQLAGIGDVTLQTPQIYTCEQTAVQCEQKISEEIAQLPDRFELFALHIRADPTPMGSSRFRGHEAFSTIKNVVDQAFLHLGEYRPYEAVVKAREWHDLAAPP